MKNGRIMIAAPKSGSGKTIITCGLLAYLKGLGIDVRSYKCGPDYIDPMFHRHVIGVPGGNLDTFFSDEEEIRRIMASSEGDAAVIEGVMGIYDGIAGASGKGSCYDVARTTETPILLVTDVKGMGITMLSVIKGILSDDTHCLIRGIVLNRISARYFDEIKPFMEKMLAEISEERGAEVKLIGGIPNARDIRLESRHLGLMMPGEIEDLKEQVSLAKDLISEHLDIETLLEIMRNASPIVAGPDAVIDNENHNSQADVTIVTAMDEAFCFYYEENLRMLEKNGIRIKPFSPLHDTALPEDADGILLGGGYPELYAEMLSTNQSMRQSVLQAVQNGMPCLAECGGFMYLLDEIADASGKSWSMCGWLRGRASNTGKLGRFGYIMITGETDDSLISGISVRGHEFHYFDSSNNGSDATAVKPGSGRSWKCLHAGQAYLIGYPHLYYPSCPELVSRFKDRMMEYKRERIQGD